MTMNAAAVSEEMEKERSMVDIPCTRTFKIKVLTYNISFTKTRSPEDAVAELNRTVEEIKAYDADIICMQEVQSNYYSTHLFPAMVEMGFDGIYQQKWPEWNPGYDPSTLDGCATFYRDSVFRLDEDKSLSYGSQVFADNCPHNLWSSYKLMAEKLKTGDVAQFLLLRVKDSEVAPIFIGNTQLWSALEPRHEEVKLIQASYFLYGLAEFLNESGVAPNIIVCGDLCSTPGSLVHQFITNGGLLDASKHNISNYHSAIQDQLKSFYNPVGVFWSAYRTFLSHGAQALDANLLTHAAFMDHEFKEPNYTNVSKELALSTTDYIFYHGTRLQVVGLLELLYDDDIEDSRHIPLGAEFIILQLPPVDPNPPTNP